MNEQIKELAGIVVAGVLALDGLLYAYWATGQTWPARTRLSRVQAVLNSNNTRAFRPVILVLLFFSGALLMLARVHRLGLFGQQIPASLLQLGILARVKSNKNVTER